VERVAGLACIATYGTTYARQPSKMPRPHPRPSAAAFLFVSVSLGAAGAELANLRSHHQPEPVTIVSDAPGDSSSETLHFSPIHVPPFPKPIQAGIGFKRTIEQVEDGATFFLQFSGGACDAKDAYGDSACQYQWGESLVANYTLQLGEKLDQEDVLKANLKVDHLVPYSFTCAVCGSDCVLKVPVVNLQWSFPTPDCPIDTNLIIDSFREDLGKTSPTDGIPVHVEGGVHIIRESSGIAAAFSVSVDLK
jgi:hypothetical protein